MTTLLDLTLDLAVPLRIAELRHHAHAYLVDLARPYADIVAAHGDVIQHRAPGTGEHTGTLITALAALALVGVDGVDFHGHHWCADITCHHPHYEEYS